MKLWAYIQLDPGYCMGYFSTSGRNLKTGNWLFFVNRKLKISEPEVKNMLDEKRVQFCSVSTFLRLRYFDQGRRQRLLKIFASYARVYRHTRTKMVFVASRFEESKNEDKTSITANFRFEVPTGS